jgi:hypothetical protein
MGVDAFLYYFDEKIFYEEVRPLLTEKKKENELLKYLEKNFPKKKFHPNLFENIGSYLDSEFQKLTEGKTVQRKVNYDLYLVLEHLVISRCVSNESIFKIGKHSLKNRFQDRPKKYPFQENSYAYEILKKLDGPSFWTHNFGGYHEGIRGWIDSVETELFFQEMYTLTFNPEYTPYYQNEIEELKSFLSEGVRFKKGILNGGDLRFDLLVSTA